MRCICPSVDADSGLALLVDAWSTLGNAGWTFDVLLPFFDKFQNYIAPSDPIKALGVTANMTAHGPSGPVTIGFSDQMFTGPQEKTFIEGQRQALSAPQVVDLGTGMSGGAGFIPQTTLPNSGQARSRVSAATAYLTEAVQKRSNLSILLNTRATKLLYSSQTAVTASGVQLQARRDGPLFSVKAKKVIVAAGAIRTPVFLEHSGIGDKAILEKLGIASKVDLPGVGKNLCEQQKNDIAATPGQPLGAGLSSPSSAISMNTIGQLMNNATDMQAYIESNIEKWAKDAVDNGASASLQGLLAQYRVTIDGIFHRQWPVAETFFVTVPDSLIQQVWALLSFSRGHVHASSTSTWDDCLVDPRYWSASIDMELQVGASRGARKVFQSSAFKSILDGEETKPGYDPSQGGIPQSSDADTTYGPYDGWQRYILDNFVSVWHPIGTAAMLPQEMGGVVDAKFKVYSTENVYVVDSSIMPMQQSTHLSSVLYAIAEKAAIDLK